MLLSTTRRIHPDTGTAGVGGGPEPADAGTAAGTGGGRDLADAGTATGTRTAGGGRRGDAAPLSEPGSPVGLIARLRQLSLLNVCTIKCLILYLENVNGTA